MVKTIDTLIEDVNGVLLGENPGGLSKDEKDKIIDKWSDAVRTGWKERFTEPKQQHRVRMSNFGKVCLRELWYHNNAEGKRVAKIEPRLLHLFSYGHQIEAQALMLAELAGHKVECYQEEAVLTPFIKGSTDAVIDGVVVDIKSTGALWKFEKGITSDDDLFGYLGQLNGYYAALCDRDEVTDHERIAFWPIDKVSGDMALDFHKPVGKDKMITYAKEVVEKAVKKKKPPEKLHEIDKGSNKGLGVSCTYCNFRFECWENLRAFGYKKGNSIRIDYLTEVNKEPKVDEIPTEDMWEVHVGKKEKTTT